MNINELNNEMKKHEAILDAVVESLDKLNELEKDLEKERQVAFAELMKAFNF